MKITIFKGAFDEDADTHLARYKEILCANHEQNDRAQLELFPNSLDKDAFMWYTWYTQFPTNHFQNSWIITGRQRRSRLIQHPTKFDREEGVKCAKLHRQTPGSHVKAVDHSTIQ